MPAAAPPLALRSGAALRQSLLQSSKSSDAPCCQSWLVIIATQACGRLGHAALAGLLLTHVHLVQDLAAGENASEPYAHFSEGYLDAGWRRTLVVRKAVSWGYNVLVTDVDLVWFKHPYLYIDRFPEVRMRTRRQLQCSVQQAAALDRVQLCGQQAQASRWVAAGLHTCSQPPLCEKGADSKTGTPDASKSTLQGGSLDAVNVSA